MITASRPFSAGESLLVVRTTVPIARGICSAGSEDDENDDDDGDEDDDDVDGNDDDGDAAEDEDDDEDDGDVDADDDDDEGDDDDDVDDDDNVDGRAEGCWTFAGVGGAGLAIEDDPDGLSGGCVYP